MAKTGLREPFLHSAALTRTRAKNCHRGPDPKNIILSSDYTTFMFVHTQNLKPGWRLNWRLLKDVRVDIVNMASLTPFFAFRKNSYVLYGNEEHEEG